MLILRKKIQQ